MVILTANVHIYLLQQDVNVDVLTVFSLAELILHQNIGNYIIEMVIAGFEGNAGN